MLTLSRLSAACCLALGLSAGMSPAFAAEPVVQRFGAWKLTIQPGVRGSGAVDPESVANGPSIRLVSQTEEESPADAAKTDEKVIPPAPAETEVDIVADPSPPAGIVVQSGAAATTRMVDPLALVQLYPQVYDSIPFSRAEYAASPSYRHDATMEFLFGQMRQTVIHRNTTVERNRAWSMPYGFGYGLPYSPYGFNFTTDPYYTPIWRPYNLW